jgi:hypothetical protein
MNFKRLICKVFGHRQRWSTETEEIGSKSVAKKHIWTVLVCTRCDRELTRYLAVDPIFTEKTLKPTPKKTQGQ